MITTVRQSTIENAIDLTTARRPTSLEAAFRFVIEQGRTQLMEVYRLEAC